MTQVIKASSYGAFNNITDVRQGASPDKWLLLDHQKSTESAVVEWDCKTLETTVLGKIYPCSQSGLRLVGRDSKSGNVFLMENNQVTGLTDLWSINLHGQVIGRVIQGEARIDDATWTDLMSAVIHLNGLIYWTNYADKRIHMVNPICEPLTSRILTDKALNPSSFGFSIPRSLSFSPNGEQLLYCDAKNKRLHTIDLVDPRHPISTLFEFQDPVIAFLGSKCDNIYSVRIRPVWLSFDAKGQVTVSVDCSYIGNDRRRHYISLLVRIPGLVGPYYIFEDPLAQADTNLIKVSGFTPDGSVFVFNDKTKELMLGRGIGGIDTKELVADWITSMAKNANVFLLLPNGVWRIVAEYTIWPHPS